MSDENHSSMLRHVLIAVGVAIMTVAVVFAAGRVYTGERPPSTNGDMLGRETGESVDHYAQRAAATVSGLDSKEPAFALVTFHKPMSITQAARIADELDVPRISAVVLNMSSPVVVPEPSAAADRREVFATALRNDLAAQFLLDDAEAAPIEGVVIWAPTRTIKTLGLNDDVAYVEALPNDAAWGHFGIMPVYRDDSAATLQQLPVAPPVPAP
ncbi:hypothetical protein CCICO_03830 [Corynebacterium ciconiae DSM 44920]|uniref:hypothetical protein n=1 Tax=Corynebacterium ciconiae TaxID=227319 RepID=UPI00035FB743|nr:hypothetical protein [Corynebacterium ciconiae]WKD60803.1 hypothetical protein CCICO_03830 [Corynebacterium ciconiae DSM 44920]